MKVLFSFVLSIIINRRLESRINLDTNTEEKKNENKKDNYKFVQSSGKEDTPKKEVKEVKEVKTAESPAARFKAQFNSHLQTIVPNDLDSVKIDHLSCRPRNATNVGIDYLVNTYFKSGKQSFYRHEMFRPEMSFSDKDYDVWQIKCSESCDAKIREMDLGDVKCLSCDDVVTKGDAKKVFTVLYPLVGKIFYEDLNAMWGKLKKKNKYEDVATAFPNTPFEKMYFKSFAKRKDGSLPRRTAAYLLIRNQWPGFEKSLLAVNKLYRVLRCSGFKKYIEAEDMYTTLINNEIIELKMPATWINSMMLNVTKGDHMALNQQKLWTTLALGYLEYFQGQSEDLLMTEPEITEEYNEQCKDVRAFNVHLWAKTRAVKCGDEGYVPPTDEEEAAEDKDKGIAIDDSKKKK